VANVRAMVPLILVLAVSCVSLEHPPRCGGEQWDIPADSLQKRVDDLNGELKVLLRSLELGTLPAEARKSVEQDFADRFKPLAKARAEGAEIWSFRYDKCPNCGWHRAGYVAVRDCRIVYEFETLDVM
jgi:hypothetical protein